MMGSFIQTMGVYPPGTVVELVNGMLVIVVSTESGLRHLPTILSLRDVDKNPCEERILDLNDSIDDKIDNGFLVKNVLPDRCYDINVKHYFDRGAFESLRLN